MIRQEYGESRYKRAHGADIHACISYGNILLICHCRPNGDLSTSDIRELKQRRRRRLGKRRLKIELPFLLKISRMAGCIQPV